MWKTPLHPVLAALFPLMSVWSTNAGYLQPSTVLPAIAVTIAGAAVVTVVAALSLRSRHAGGVLALASVAVFFSYTPLLDSLRSVLGPELVRERYVFGVLILVLITVGVLAWRKKSKLARATSVLNTLSAAFLVVPLCLVAHGVANRAADAGPLSSDVPSELRSLTRPESVPDVYFLLLDAYGRHDAITRIFGHDNEPFLDELQKRGFYVARKSNCNYPRTVHSLTSTFHMTYLDRLTELYGAESNQVEPITDALHDNPVWETFERFGYRTAAVQTGFHWADFKRADDFHRFGLAGEDSEYSRRILGLTPIPSVRRWFFSSDNKKGFARSRVRQALDFLASTVGDSGPKFVFGHVVCPHPPFVHAVNGENPGKDYQWASSRAEGFRERKIRDPDYVAGYGPQVRFLNDEVIELIDRILKRSRVPPVIIIQGDHGSGSLLHPTDPEKTDLAECFPILNALYFPDGDYSALYGSISSVNTFRVVFGKYFGAHLPLLEDRHYFSRSMFVRPYDFLDVTERIEGN